MNSILVAPSLSFIKELIVRNGSTLATYNITSNVYSAVDSVNLRMTRSFNGEEFLFVVTMLSSIQTLNAGVRIEFALIEGTTPVGGAVIQGRSLDISNSASTVMFTSFLQPPAGVHTYDLGARMSSIPATGQIANSTDAFPQMYFFILNRTA